MRAATPGTWTTPCGPEQDGVKLEAEVLITADGPVMLSLYPHEEKLL